MLMPMPVTRANADAHAGRAADWTVPVAADEPREAWQQQRCVCVCAQTVRAEGNNPVRPSGGTAEQEMARHS